jgi:hypothetical protein
VNPPFPTCHQASRSSAFRPFRPVSGARHHIVTPSLLLPLALLRFRASHTRTQGTPHLPQYDRFSRHRTSPFRPSCHLFPSIRRFCFLLPARPAHTRHLVTNLVTHRHSLPVSSIASWDPCHHTSSSSSLYLSSCIVARSAASAVAHSSSLFSSLDREAGSGIAGEDPTL